MFKFLVKLPRHKQFHYKPLYYNEAKEELEERVRRIKEQGSSREIPFSRGSLKESWGHKSRIAQQSRSTRIRMMIILGLLLALFWYLFAK